MKFPNRYHILKRNLYESGNKKIVPIRYEDRLLIMRWRNEQMYHLRQQKVLTETDQNQYFDTIVSKLFDANQPNQLLFSYLQDDVCIGYGGLVHINWGDKNAEISFIIDPEFEKEYFQQHWTTYLSLIEQVAFEGLDLRKIYTYAFDLRPHLYKAVEAAGFEKEAELKEHFLHYAEYKSVVIHSKINPIGIRPVTIDDLALIFEWSNDELTRANSFQQEPILFDAHCDWFTMRLKDKCKHSFICTFRDEPAAFLRLDQQDDHAIIGINIAPKFRGEGLSSVFLKKAHQTISNLIPDIKIRALIKDQNTPSIKCFERAGYRLISNTVVEGVKTLIYQL